MLQKQFLIVIGTGIFCALLFAAPGLHRIYKDINDPVIEAIAPVKFPTKTVSWGENKFDVEFNLVLTRDEAPEQSKSIPKNAIKVFIAAEITNTSANSMEVQSLDFLLSCGKVELLRQPFMSYPYPVKPFELKPKEAKQLQTSAYVSRDTLHGLITGEVSINGAAATREVTQQ